MSNFSYKQRPLREIWERECIRLEDVPLEISYHTASNTIQYKDDTGVLTARLFPETGEEKLYFRDANAPEGSKYGVEVAYARENGKIHGDTLSKDTGKPVLCNLNMSMHIAATITDWELYRDTISVVDTGKIPPPKKANREYLELLYPSSKGKQTERE